MITDVCRALVCMHARNWVHADLKPCNVVMSAKHFKLIDFGLSELMESEQISEGVQLEMSKGTSFYKAPEVFDEEWRLYGQFTDMWGVGVMAFLMMGLRHPISDFMRTTDPKKNIGNIGLNESFVHSQYSADLQVLVYRMISTDHRNRPSAEEVLRHKFLYIDVEVDRKALFNE